ncbi:hypothetical protein BG005_002572, partial [Podila minutissima]
MTNSRPSRQRPTRPTSGFQRRQAFWRKPSVGSGAYKRWREVAATSPSAGARSSARQKRRMFLDPQINR